jgi:CheY-like chemotaxis protein
VTYGAVRQHGGIIEVDSAEHEGTTFRIYVPTTSAPAERVPPPEWSIEAPRGMEQIMLVEDQDEVRSTISRLLSTHGYTVIEASNGAEALRRIQLGEANGINLLITDLVMPDVGGEALVTGMRPDFPTLPVLVISGFDQRGSVRRMFERGDASAFLEKPFEARPMLKLVRELLDSAARRSLATTP